LPSGVVSHKNTNNKDHFSRRSCRSGSQWTGLVRHGGLKTAQEAHADIQSKITPSCQQPVSIVETPISGVTTGEMG